jgi:F0F1-type ATP synthase assembly protein I
MARPVKATAKSTKAKSKSTKAKAKTRVIRDPMAAYKYVGAAVGGALLGWFA